MEVLRITYALQFHPLSYTTHNTFILRNHHFYYVISVTELPNTLYFLLPPPLSLKHTYY